jgi:hypothetical protein
MLVAVAGALIQLGGCASQPTGSTFSVPAGSYEQAFDHSKDVVRAWGFELDRVDAARGVITTRPVSASGFATPWINHAQGLGDAWRNTARPERRLVRIAFIPDSGASEADVRTHDGSFTGSVEVAILVLDRPWRRPDPTSIRFTSVALDPVAINQGNSGVREYEAGLDEGLGSRLAASINRLTTGD